MKNETRYKRLHLVALIVEVATLAFWLMSGAHWGWNQISVIEMQIDEIIGLEYPVRHDAFVARVEVLGAGLLPAMTLSADSSVLPLSLNASGEILVAGPRSHVLSSGSGSSRVRSKVTTTPIEGLLNVFGKKRIQSFDADTDFDVVMSTAPKAELALYFAQGHTSGESKGLRDLDLPGNQETEISAAGNLSIGPRIGPQESGNCRLVAES